MKTITRHCPRQNLGNKSTALRERGLEAGKACDAQSKEKEKKELIAE